MTRFVLMVCILAANGGLMFGYDVGISGEFVASSFLLFYLDCMTYTFGVHMSTAIYRITHCLIEF